MQSGATPPPRLLLEIVGVKGFIPSSLKVPFVYPCLTQRQKKSPRNRLLVPFYVKHSKGFISRLVELLDVVTMP